MLRSQALKRSSWKKWIAALLYEAHNLRQAACLHATSDVEAASFRAYGLQNPIALIPLGISPNWLEGVGDGARFCRKNAIPGDTRIMLFLSRIHPIKGLPLLLEALARIRSLLDGWHLAIVGPDEGGHGRELQRLAQRLGITDLVTFGDAVFGDDKRDAFAAAELFVLPTNSENFSFAVAEALGAGVPVITTQGAPWQDLLGYHCGWWIDISTTALQDALVAATRLSRAELVEMGQRGRDLVARKYTWRQVGEQSLMLYEWLLGRSDRPSFVITD
jgi:glycosyltransferase involved in cell wall biosynthesis